MRGRVRVFGRDLRFLLSLRDLPWRVAVFQWRAWRLGARLGDEFGRGSSTRPEKLATVLKLAGDGRYVVELGTAQAWTAISLALACPDRQVVTYDPFERLEPHKYMGLVPEHVRRRVNVLIASGQDGPPTDQPVDLLYIDSTHERADTIRELEVWRPVLREGGRLSSGVKTANNASSNAG